MSQKPILYSLDFSPSARTVLLTAEYIGLELEIRNVDINKNEQMSETFLQVSKHEYNAKHELIITIIQ